MKRIFKRVIFPIFLIVIGILPFLLIDITGSVAILFRLVGASFIMIGFIALVLSLFSKLEEIQIKKINKTMKQLDFSASEIEQRQPYLKKQSLDKLEIMHSVLLKEKNETKKIS